MMVVVQFSEFNGSERTVSREAPRSGDARVEGLCLGFRV
jgi:hypothetical protein